MGAPRTFARAVAAAVIGAGASLLAGRWWSPVCHEDCPSAIVAAMWLLLLALPLALAVAAARGRPLARVGMTLAAFAVLGLAATAAAAWFQGHPQGR